jgi:hypothetical protein
VHEREGGAGGRDPGDGGEAVGLVARTVPAVDEAAAGARPDDRVRFVLPEQGGAVGEAGLAAEVQQFGDRVLVGAALCSTARRMSPSSAAAPPSNCSASG